MSAPRPNLAPTQGQANPGNLAAAMLDIRNGLTMLQRALPNIPMGSPLWGDIHMAIGKLAKHASEDLPMGPLNQAALSMMRERSQDPMREKIMAMMGGANANAPPAMPPPAA